MGTVWWLVTLVKELPSLTCGVVGNSRFWLTHTHTHTHTHAHSWHSVTLHYRCHIEAGNKRSTRVRTMAGDHSIIHESFFAAFCKQSPVKGTQCSVNA